MTITPLHIKTRATPLVNIPTTKPADRREFKLVDPAVAAAKDEPAVKALLADAAAREAAAKRMQPQENNHLYLPNISTMTDEAAKVVAFTIGRLSAAELKTIQVSGGQGSEITNDVQTYKKWLSAFQTRAL